MKKLPVFWLLLLSVTAASYCLPASEEEVAEYNIKAAFLYQFVDYTEWPDGTFTDDGSPVVVGVLNADLLAGILEQFSLERSAKGRTVEIRRLEPDAPFSDLHVLFIGRNDSEAAESLLLNASGMSVLTVTEESSARPSGSIINFEIVDNKVRFDISLTPAEQGNLKISSRLLQVAQRITN